MKKLLFLGFILTLFSAAVSAQQASDESFRHHPAEHRDELSRPEMRRLHHDQRRFEIEKHRGYRDNRISRRERHRLYRMHRREHREFYGSRHHHHHRSL
jgi:hypothetical protein